MSDAKPDDIELCAKFSRIYWHDSKLLDIHVLRHPEKNSYELRLELNLIVNFSEGEVARKKRTALFLDCRVIQLDLDLLGVLLCGGDIASAGCYSDALALERKKRDKLRLFDLPQNQNLLETCIGFFIEMIPPGGEIVVFARHFELV